MKDIRNRIVEFHVKRQKSATDYHLRMTLPFGV